MRPDGMSLAHVRGMMTSLTRGGSRRDPDRRRDARQQIEQLAWLLDQAIPIPFTGRRIGIDGIIGLIPGVGDIASGAMGLIVILRAAQYGLPKVVIARMLANTALDFTVGVIPVLGDAFDLWYKANWRNARLFAVYSDRPETSTRGQWVFFAAIAVAVIGAAVLLAWLLTELLNTLAGAFTF